MYSFFAVRKDASGNRSFEYVCSDLLEFPCLHKHRPLRQNGSVRGKPSVLGYRLYLAFKVGLGLLFSPIKNAFLPFDISSGVKVRHGADKRKYRMLENSLEF